MGWEDLAAKRKAKIQDAIPQEWRLKEIPPGDSVMSVPSESGILSADELAITESYATDLVCDLAAGRLTSVAVTMAFLKRAALAQQTVAHHIPLSAIRFLTASRLIVCMSSCLTTQLRGLSTLMIT